MLTNLDERTIELIEKEYLINDLPWSLGYSGGKDSSALLKLTYNAVLNLKNRNKIITIVYCDTGVEIPILRDFVYKTFDKFKNEILENQLPFKVKIVEPKLENRFFSKLIGKGYPPPTNKFRWCTDRLRVMPIQQLQNNNKNENIVLVGIRQGESKERDKIISRHNTKNPYYFKQTNFPKVKIFAPIIDYKISDIWSILKNNKSPNSINGIELESIYLDAGTNQIDFKDISSPSLEKGKFGCWVCTVVRKDKAVSYLIENGHNKLIPLFNFRNLIYDMRSIEQYRCKWRRNGVKGFGPFTIEARKLILNELLKAQIASGYNLIEDKEIDYIKEQWLADQNSLTYKE